MSALLCQIVLLLHYWRALTPLERKIHVEISEFSYLNARTYFNHNLLSKCVNIPMETCFFFFAVKENKSFEQIETRVNETQHIDSFFLLIRCFILCLLLYNLPYIEPGSPPRAHPRVGARASCRGCTDLFTNTSLVLTRGCRQHCPLAGGQEYRLVGQPRGRLEGS